MDDASDAELVRRSLSGDHEAYGALVLRHQRSLRLALAWQIDDPELIDEFVQEGFVCAFQRLDQFDNQRPFYPWLRQLTRNRLLEHLRTLQTRARHRQRLAVHAHLQEDDQAAPTDELLHALQHCYEELSAPARDLLEQRYRHGAGLGRLASLLQTSSASIKARLFRLRRHLRRCINARLETGR